MKHTNPDDAFTAQPPAITLGGRTVQLRPLATTIAPKLQRIAGIIDDLDPDTAFGIAYAVTHAIKPAEALDLMGDDESFTRAIHVAAAEIDMDDAQAIGAYLSALLARVEKSAVEMPDTGKPAAD